jgi:Zn ribbon nucleic-acid-binding protein
MPGSCEPRSSELTESCQICKAQAFSQLFRTNGFDILKCSSCGIVFTRPA